MSSTTLDRYAAVAGGAVLALVLAACGGPSTPPSSDPSMTPSTAPSSTPSSTPSTPAPSSPAPSSPPPSKPVTEPSTQEPVADQVEIDITVSGGKVDPSGKKIDVPVGATVVLNVRSDVDDEIHAHVGSGDGYELQVTKGVPAQGRFTVAESGSFEIESHELGKIIAILNVR